MNQALFRNEWIIEDNRIYTVITIINKIKLSKKNMHLFVCYASDLRPYEYHLLLLKRELESKSNKEQEKDISFTHYISVIDNIVKGILPKNQKIMKLIKDKLSKKYLVVNIN